MHLISQYLDLELSLDVQDIPLVEKYCKLLPRARYYNQMVNKNGEPLCPTIYNMPTFSIHPRPSILHHQLDIFYDTLVVSGCTK
jgi:hypothetical protein